MLWALLRLLHTNDFHGQMTEAMAHRLRSEKEDDTLYFDSGDGLKSGNLAVPLRREDVWGHLAVAGCDASVPGNRETHVLRSAVEAKLAGKRHPLVCANWFDKAGNLVFEPSVSLRAGDVKVGVLGVMVPIVTRKMATAPASHFLWENPIACAAVHAKDLKQHHDVVIALTHIGYPKDLELAETVPEIDIVLGGHSHTVLDFPHKVGTVWVAQGGSHGRYFGDYWWDGSSLMGGLRPFG